MRCATFYFPSQRINFGRAGICVRGCGAKRSIYWRISPFCPCTQYFAFVPLMCGFRLSAIWKNIFCASPLDSAHEEQSILLFRPTKRSFPPSFSRLIFLWEMYARTYIFLKASFRRETFSFFPGSFIPSLPAAEEGGKSKRRVKRYIGRKRENGVPATGGGKEKGGGSRFPRFSSSSSREKHCRRRHHRSHREKRGEALRPATYDCRERREMICRHMSKKLFLPLSWTCTHCPISWRHCEKSVEYHPFPFYCGRVIVWRSLCFLSSETT